MVSYLPSVWKELDLQPYGPLGPTFSPDPSFLPFQRADGSIRTRAGGTRCELLPREIVNRGMNCIVQKGMRKTKGTSGSGTSTRKLVAIKRPRYPSHILTGEALLQSLVHTFLTAEGIPGGVPAVYDLFIFANEIRFTMEWIEGKSCYEYLFQRIAPADFERMFFHILFQLSFLLHTIQKHLPLDHRDMKLDNLWIVEAPVKYTVHLPAIVPTTYTAPIRVVLLDFGFACLGTAEQTTVLNLGNVIPDVDPCPKEGRDLYHILNRMLEPPAARQALSSSALELFERWMAPYGRSRHSETHILTSYPHFAIPSLHPTNFLRWFLETRYFEN